MKLCSTHKHLKRPWCFKNFLAPVRLARRLTPICRSRTSRALLWCKLTAINQVPNASTVSSDFLVWMIHQLTLMEGRGSQNFPWCALLAARKQVFVVGAIRTHIYTSTCTCTTKAKHQNSFHLHVQINDRRRIMYLPRIARKIANFSSILCEWR